MLYESTKVFLDSVLRSLQNPDSAGWDDHEESATECLYEMHQMARPQYKGYRTDGANKSPVLVPVYERAARAIPHIKSMAKAIRRKDQLAALENGRAALAEL
jgi:hypothetical protein